MRLTIIRDAYLAVNVQQFTSLLSALPSGDNSPHEIWNESFSSTLEASQFVLDYLAQQLPNFTIYPAMGNHGES